MMNVPMSLLFTALGIALSGVLAFWKIWWDIQSFRSDLDVKFEQLRANTEKQLAELRQERERRIGRIYERFDEHKSFVDVNFVRSQMCGLAHQTSLQQFTDLKASVDELRGMLFAFIQEGKAKL